MSYFSMAAYVSILRKLISWSFYNRALPKSNLNSGSAPGWVFYLRRACNVAGTYREKLLRCRHEVLLSGGHTHLRKFYRLLVKLLAGMADISLNSTTSPKKCMHFV